MTRVAVALLLVALGRADAATRWDVRARGESWAQLVESDGVSQTITENVLELRGALHVEQPSLGLDAEYAPAMAVVPPLSRAAPMWRHHARARLEWQFVRTWRAWAGAEGSYGRERLVLGANALSSATPDAGANVPRTPERIPTPDVFLRRTLRAEGGIETDVTRRLRTALSVVFRHELAMDPAFRASFPTGRSVVATSRASWDATRLDVLSARAEVEAAEFEPGHEVRLAHAAAGIRREVARRTWAWAEAGAGVARDLAARGATTATGLGEVGAEHVAQGRGLGGSALARFSPAIDRISGVFAQRADALASAAWSPGAKWRIEALGAAGVFTSGSLSGRRLGVAEARLSRTLAPDLEVVAGFRSSWQESTAAPRRLSEQDVFLVINAGVRGP